MAFTHAWSDSTRPLGNLSSLFNQSIFHYLTQERQLDRLHPSPNILAFSLVLFIALLALAANFTSIVAYLSWSKMRQAQNIMLVNISIADVFFCVVSLVPAFATHIFDSPSNTTMCRLVYYCLSVCLYVSVYSPVVACLFRCLSELMRRQASKQRHCSNRGRGLDEHKDVFFNSFRNDPNPRHDSFLTPTSAVLSCIVLWVAFSVANANVFHSRDPTTASILVLHQPLQCDHPCFMSLKQREELQRQKEREVHSPSEVFKQHFNKKIQPQKHLHQQQRQQQLAFPDSSNDDASSEDITFKQLWLIFLISAFLCPLTLISLLSGLLLFTIHCTRTPNRAPITELTNSARITSSLTASPVSYSPFTATNSMLADYAAVVSSRKDAVVLVMAISIVRFLCWLPIQVCLLIDIYGFTTHYHNNNPVSFHQRMEVFGACCALFACCINPFIYLASSSDFRRSLVRCRRRWCRRKQRKNLSFNAINAARMQTRGLPKPDLCTPTTPLDHPLRHSVAHHASIFPPSKNTHDTNDTILSILCDSSNKINYN